MPEMERGVGLSKVVFGPDTWRVDPDTGILSLTEQALASVLNPDPFDQWYTVDPEPIASGQFAVVYHCTHRVTGRPYAAKFAARRRLGDDASATIVHEVAVNVILNQCHINVKLEDVFQTETDYVLVMEFAGGGDLQSVLDEEIVPYEETVADFLKQLLRGLLFIHDSNLVHLDIKPQNLVLMGEYPECEIKLVDFEISRYIKPGSEVIDFLGTPDYVAPEILCLDPITTKTDMWSVGVLSYVLLCGFLPFDSNSDQQTFIEILRGDINFPSELFDDVSEDAIDFIKKLLQREPEQRMSAKDCLEHPWMNKSFVPSLPAPVIEAINEPATLENVSDVTETEAEPLPLTEVSKAMETSAETLPVTEVSDVIPDKEIADISITETPIVNIEAIPEITKVEYPHYVTAPLPVMRAESSPSVIGSLTFQDNENFTDKASFDEFCTQTNGVRRPPHHPNVSQKSMSVASELGSPKSLHTPLPAVTPFLHKESRMGSRQNLDRLKTISKSREVLYEKIQKNKVMKSLSKSRERLFDPKLSMSASRQDLLKCRNLSQSIEALSALTQIHKSEAFHKSCNNLLKPTQRLARIQERMHRSMAAINTGKNEKNTNMQCYQSKYNLNEEYNDFVTQRNTNMNTDMIYTGSAENSYMNVSQDTKLGGLRANPCRGGRSAEGSDRDCCHRRPQPQSTQICRKTSKADRMKKDAQRRRQERKEREMREQQKHRKYSLGSYEAKVPEIETPSRTENVATSPKLRRGSVCHVEQRLQERHEKYIERQEKLGRLENSEGSTRLSSTDSEKSYTSEKPSKHSAKSKAPTSTSERPKRRRNSKLESLTDSDTSTCSSMESVLGSSENITTSSIKPRPNTKTPQRERKKPQFRDSVNILKMEKVDEVRDKLSKITPPMADILEENANDSSVETDENTNQRNEQPKIVGVVLKQNVINKMNSNESLDSVTLDAINTKVTIENEMKNNLSDAHFNYCNSLGINHSLTRTLSNTSDLGSSLSEASETHDRTDEMNCVCRSQSFQRKSSSTNMLRQSLRKRSNSSVGEHDSKPDTKAKPWREVCSGSVAKALRNFDDSINGSNHSLNS